MNSTKLSSYTNYSSQNDDERGLEQKQKSTAMPLRRVQNELKVSCQNCMERLQATLKYSTDSWSCPKLSQSATKVLVESAMTLTQELASMDRLETRLRNEAKASNSILNYCSILDGVSAVT